MATPKKDQKEDAKKKVRDLLRNISASTQQLADQSIENERSTVTASPSGVMFIDNQEYAHERGRETEVNKGVESNTDELVWLDPSECYAIKQVREDIKETDVRERRLSIEAHGQIKPIEVYPKDEKGYQIITGEVRWRASLIEPKLSVWAIIRRSSAKLDENLEAEKTETKKILKQVAENTEAIPLSIYEIATSLRRAMEVSNVQTHEELSRLMGWYDESRPDYGRAKVSQYLALFNLCERGQKLYLEGKMSDVRAIKILSSIRTQSLSSYNAVLTMIENGETVTRKMLEKERDKFKEGAGTGTGTSKDEKKSEQKGSKSERNKLNASSAEKGGKNKSSDEEEPEVYPGIFFNYNRKLVQLVFKEAPAGMIFCKVVGDQTDSLIQIDSEEVTFSHFTLPK